ncbi:MAG: GIY-YIG nuclease family protein [Sphingobacteriales bacterium]|nr:MAG: GIY-YIG nuclease family protein [Sphingobacteriales bacterium]
MKAVSGGHTAGYVYILTNTHRTTLYIGVTSDLERRLWQHRHHVFKNSFTDRYNLEILLYWEAHDRIAQAILREKELKGWRRAKKEALIATQNPEWLDLGSSFLQI